jgi:hypothetical protein
MVLTDDVFGAGQAGEDGPRGQPVQPRHREPQREPQRRRCGSDPSSSWLWLCVQICRASAGSAHITLDLWLRAGGGDDKTVAFCKAHGISYSAFSPLEGANRGHCPVFMPS